MSRPDIEEIRERRKYAQNGYEVITGEWDSETGFVKYRFDGLRTIDAGMAKFLTKAPDDVEALLNYIAELEYDISMLSGDPELTTREIPGMSWDGPSLPQRSRSGSTGK